MSQLSRLAALALALILAPLTARAGFDTWIFPGAPLPLKLVGVEYHRADRRDVVAQAIAALAAEQLRESGLFRAGAPHGVTVDLRDVVSTATTEPDGAGVGRAEILYRVTDDTGNVLFNDRIATTVRVGVAESVGLMQSTPRAARYRAFVRNLETFSLRFWRATMPPATDEPARIDAIALAHPLETPQRSADFTARIGAALEVLVPQSRAQGALPLVLRVDGLDLRTLPASGEIAAAEARLALALTLADGGVLWQGTATGKGEVGRQRALAAGVSPVDTALANALQRALAGAAPEIAAAMTEAASLAAAATERKLPYRLEGIAAGPDLVGTDLLARLQRWNLPDQPLAAVWRADAPPVVVRLDAATAAVRKTGKSAGVAEIAARYTVLDGDGRVLLNHARTTSAPFDAADARLRGLAPGDWAVRVGLRQSWVELLDALAALPKP